MNGSDSAHGARPVGNGLPLPFRPPTVDEALQYSPLSSIVPFTPDIIPFPAAGPQSSPPIFTTTQEREMARRTLDSFSTEVMNPDDTSRRLQKTLQDLQRLLKEDDITEFTFKKPAATTASVTSQQQPRLASNGATYPSSFPRLSPLANLLLTRTNPAYIIPDTAASDHTSHKGDVPVNQDAYARKSHPMASDLFQAQMQNASAAEQNSQIRVSPRDVEDGLKPSKPAIIIAAAPSSQREEYEMFPDIDAKISAGEHEFSRKRKQEDIADQEAFNMTLDHRQKADESVQNLHNLVIEILEAEDNYRLDHSDGHGLAQSSTFFMPIASNDSGIPPLNPATHSKLESALQKVILSSRISHIPVDHLSRIQKLCETAVTSIQETSLSIGEDWSPHDADEWVSRVGQVENGLRASRVLLRIMAAGREEKELYSEDILNNINVGLNHIVDACIIPVAETRSSGTTAEKFKILSTYKKQLSSLLQMTGKVLRLLGDLVVKMEGAEAASYSLESLVVRLLFIENAHTEKDSSIGIQKFELLRRHAMDVVAKIFTRYPSQRVSILTGILSELERLPSTRQSARQFKLIDGKPIQLISALFMRLIQTSATHYTPEKQKKSNGIVNEEDDADGESDSDTEQHVYSRGVQAAQNDIGIDGNNAIDQLISIARPQYETARMNAHHIVKFIVDRALTSTKSGDQPYRNLLDIFVEDFLSVLGNTDWPGAEMLLTLLATRMISLLSEESKSPVPHKNMALDLMGLMGSGISDLQIHTRQLIRSLDPTQSQLSAKLVQIADGVLEDSVKPPEILSFDGPYRVIIEYLQARDVNDAQLQSARGFFTTQWAQNLYRPFVVNDEYKGGNAESDDLAGKLRHMLLDPTWLEKEYEFEKVTTAQGRLAGAVIALQSPFCMALPRIVNQLLTFMSNEHATLKSRSLKSVVQILEKDPSILDRSNTVLAQILGCCSDNSLLVRDSALNLVGKCLALKPALESQPVVFNRVISACSDDGVGVRKRAMKLLKDMYLRSEDREAKSAIADALLQRIKDSDESVTELAHRIFEEIWMSPFHFLESVDHQAVQSKIAFRALVSLIIQTVRRGTSVLEVLDTLLVSLLSSNSKNAASNFRVCKEMVATMFEGVIEASELPGAPQQHDILQTLTVFAKANAKLFKGEQLALLKPYVSNLSTTDDLRLYTSVLIIFRHVFPYLGAYQRSFFSDVQKALLNSLSKLPRTQLDEAIQCLWIINGILQDTQRLVRLTISVLLPLDGSAKLDLTGTGEKGLVPKTIRYISIAGSLGKACNLDDYAADFRDKFSTWKGSSVAGLVVDKIYPFTRQKYPQDLRQAAFENIGMICQAWPKQFLRTDISTAYELVFKNNDDALERVVLTGFERFFASEEKRSESGAEIAVGEGAIHGSERLAISLVASDNDGVSTTIARRFLPHITRVALASLDAIALTATKVIASINRQGLVHPKECGPALVALETSPNKEVSRIAYEEHRNLHHKHETMFEKEYMRAVAQAFQYQKDILKDSEGATTKPYAPKLHLLFEVLKSGNSKVRKKFLSNLASRVNFELSKLNTKGDQPQPVLFARFCLQNLAFFDYPRIDELMYLIKRLEAVVANTGTGVAHSIETEIFKINIESVKQSQIPPGQPSREELPANQASEPDPMDLVSVIAPSAPASDIATSLADIDLDRLRHLTVASMILSMAWETRCHLRRLWGLQKQGESKSKTALKDLNKAPTKVAFVSGDPYAKKIEHIMAALTSPDFMLAQCREFVELLSVDSELKVGSDDDEDGLVNAAVRQETPDGDDGAERSAPPSGSGRGRKRQSSFSAGGTPKKARKRGRPPKKQASHVSTASGEDDDADGDWI